MKGRHIYSVLGLFLLAIIIFLNFTSNSDPSEIKIPIPWLQPKMSFITRNATHFVELEYDDRSNPNSSTTPQEPFYINGWNSYWFLSASAAGFKPQVSEMLRRGREMRLTVCRTWAFDDGSHPGALQVSPGQFDEQVFQALDYVIYEARRNRIRLILCLVNNLDAFGGKAQYVRWANGAGANVTNSTDYFFADPIVKRYYKDYVKAILTRRNSYSGIRYSDEPAIFAWDLMNEPRCVSNSSGSLLQAWIVEMASFIKTLDNKHLVTIGLEGFYGPGRAERLGVNPGNWATSLCSDFIQNSAIEQIDFASVHAYPDSWIPKASLEEKVRHIYSWMDSHLNDSETVLKKPVLFSEVGGYQQASKDNSTFDRDILLKIVYDEIYKSAKNRQAGAGALIWQLMVENTQPYQDDFSLVAREHPSTYKLIVEQSCRLQTLFRKENNTDLPCSKLP